MKILCKRGENAPQEQFLLFCTILCNLMFDFCGKTRTRFSLRDKRLFQTIEVEITRVDCIFFDIRGHFEISVLEISSNDCISHFCMSRGVHITLLLLFRFSVTSYIFFLSDNPSKRGLLLKDNSDFMSKF